MTETDLLYVLKIAECGNLTMAASELYISQPSLSQALSRIEHEYGKALFERLSSGLVLTAFGEKYVETVYSILRQYHNFENELDKIRKAQRGELRFGLPQYLGTMLLPEILPAFTRKYPDIKIHYYENTSKQLYQMLQNGKIDFAILHHYGARDRFCTEHLMTEPFCLVTPAGKEISEKPPFITADLRNFAARSFILTSPGYLSREIADTILEKSGISPSVKYITKNMETAKRLTAAGLGVTLLPMSYLNLFSGTEKLSVYTLPPHECISWDLIVSHRQNMILSFAAQEFIHFLKNFLSYEYSSSSMRTISSAMSR